MEIKWQKQRKKWLAALGILDSCAIAGAAIRCSGRGEAGLQEETAGAVGRDEVKKILFSLLIFFFQDLFQHILLQKL